MADEIDNANDHIEKSLALAIKAQRQTTKKLLAVGTCYNCGESVANNLLFCDSDCRDDYQFRTDRK